MYSFPKSQVCIKKISFLYLAYQLLRKVKGESVGLTQSRVRLEQTLLCLGNKMWVEYIFSAFQRGKSAAFMFILSKKVALKSKQTLQVVFTPIRHSWDARHMQLVQTAS